MASEGFEVRESPTHGKGVFATRAFAAGELIGEFEGEPTDKNGTHVIWLVSDEGEERGLRGTNELRFLNHDAKPNAEFRVLELHALRAIRTGEELTIDYGPEYEDGSF